MVPGVAWVYWRPPGNREGHGYLINKVDIGLTSRFKVAFDYGRFALLVVYYAKIGTVKSSQRLVAKVE